MPKNSALLLAASLCLRQRTSPQRKPTHQQSRLSSHSSKYSKERRLQGWRPNLQDVSPVTVFFSDRPKWIVGNVRNDLFLQNGTEGGNSFKSDPPNAVLSIFNDKTPPTSAVLVLNNPRLEGKNLTYDVRTLKGDLPASGIEGTLFIDGSSGYCDPGYDRGDPGYPCWAQKAFADDTP